MKSFAKNLLPLATAVLVSSMASTALAGEIFSTGGVAINGYDPVSYFTDHKPVKGSEAFSTPYKGTTFHFASAEHRDTFLSDPKHYAPQYGGFCAYGTAKGHKASTEPQAFTIVGDKLYLNYNEEVLKTWRQDAKGYIHEANRNWAEVRKQPQL